MEYLTTANVLLWVFLTLAFYLVFLSHWLVAASLFPDYVEHCETRYSRPVVTTLASGVGASVLTWFARKPAATPPPVEP
jgi:hypothetical protein